MSLVAMSVDVPHTSPGPCPVAVPVADRPGAASLGAAAGVMPATASGPSAPRQRTPHHRPQTASQALRRMRLEGCPSFWCRSIPDRIRSSSDRLSARVDLSGLAGSLSCLATTPHPANWLRIIHVRRCKNPILELERACAREQKRDPPCAQAVMSELKVMVLGAHPSRCISAKMRSAVSHCPAFSHALISEL